jgi:hypothetical protein
VRGAARHGLGDHRLIADRDAQQRDRIGRVDPAGAIRVGKADVAGAQDRAAGAPVADLQRRGRLAVRIAEHVLCAFGRHEREMAVVDASQQRDEQPGRQRQRRLRGGREQTQQGHGRAS